MPVDVLRVDSVPDAVPVARRWVVERLAGTEADDLTADAELVVSELVTNALLHGSPPVTVRVEIGETVRVEVGDGSRRAPMQTVARADAMTGRGLALVATVAHAWGVAQREGGKVVWCELSRHATDVDAEPDVDTLLAAWGDDEDAGTEQRYTVALGDVPTDLLLAAKAHVDNLVREFALARHADAGHAGTITPELARLVEAVVARFGEARQAIKRQAVESAALGRPRTTLTLTVPLDAAAAGERYLDALDEIDTYARAARLLTLETPPQHRVFRRWYVESLVAQLRAAAAGRTVETETFERRLLREVAVIEVARRAADRAARLQTVSAGLVGATTADDVGRVVVSEAVAALGAVGGGLIVLGPDEHLDVVSWVGYDEPLLDRLHSETRWTPLPSAVALRTGEPVWIESRDERDERYPALTDLEPGVVSMCAVPLHSTDHVLGVLRFSFDVPRLFDEHERRFILTLAGQTAHALERATATAAARAANEKLQFLAEASAALAESLDYRTTLRNVTRLAVPRLADWCVVHIAEDGEIQALSLAHSDPQKVEFAEALQRRYPVDPDAPAGVANVIRTGASELLTSVPDDLILKVARDEDHLAGLREFGFTSALIVPLAARGRVFGALSMFHSESRRHYDETDLALAEDLAHRAALAIDNANLFRALSERE